MAARLPRKGAQPTRSGKLSTSATPGTSSSSQHNEPRSSTAASSSVPGTSSTRRRSRMERRWKFSQSFRQPHRSSSALGHHHQSERAKKSSINEGKTVRQKTESSLPDDGETHSSSETLAPSRMRRTSSMPSICDLTTRQGMRHYDYDAKLNRLQKRSLRFTWHRLQTRNGGKRVDNVFEEVYDRMVKQQPIIRDMFTTRTFLSAMSRSDIATLRDHARVTVKMIDHVIKNLDQDVKKRSDTGSELDPRLIGRAHGILRPYGFTGNYWEKLGETIIDVVLAQEAVRDLPGAGQAWVILTACLVDQMRAGFDESKSHTSTSMVTQKVLYNAAAQLDDGTSPDTPAECSSTTYVVTPASYSPGHFTTQQIPSDFMSEAATACTYNAGNRRKSRAGEREVRGERRDSYSESRVDPRDVRRESREMATDPRNLYGEHTEGRGEFDTRTEPCEYRSRRAYSIRDGSKQSREKRQSSSEPQAPVAANTSSSSGTNGVLPTKTSITSPFTS
uniref:Globin-like protein 9 n=2 Tax=Ascaris TaxID=6251 RepID=F1L1R7_ASCSU